MRSTNYAIITVGGKQYVVREGERLLVDRLATEEGKTFHPQLLFVGGDGTSQLDPSGTVTARVVGHVRGDKIRIGKYRPKSGYRRHTGFRAALSEIAIESIGGAKGPAATPEQEAPAERAEEAATPAAQPPRGYPEFTVAEISEKAKRWKLESIEAALEYEHAHANRKGALAALEAALEAKREKQ